eukprot:2206956-Alexandrium_andersonii.AAC.1
MGGAPSKVTAKARCARAPRSGGCERRKRGIADHDAILPAACEGLLIELGAGAASAASSVRAAAAAAQQLRNEGFQFRLPKPEASGHPLVHVRRNSVCPQCLESACSSARRALKK